MSGLTHFDAAGQAIMVDVGAKAETERIWLFLAPLVILAAAPHVRRPRVVVAALAAQAVVYELLFDTLW